MPTHATLADWIRREAIPFSAESWEAFNAGADKLVASLGDSVELLGFGEALHGGEEIMALRNRLFQRLATVHGYSAIAIESSFPRGRLANEYIAGRGPATYHQIQEDGFSHGFGRLDANRELIEWMRSYNADPQHLVQLRFYGFDIPVGLGGYSSPRQVLHFALDYLSSIDGAIGAKHRQQIDELIGQDFDWENLAIYADPSKAVGLSPNAMALRIATEDLLTELRTRRPELVVASGKDQFREALQHALVARELLNSHAALARQAGYAAVLGIRDAVMADNLAYITARERARGKVLVFAHNGHLQRGKADFPMLGQWWPAGAQLNERLGARYAAIGSAVGVSEANGIAAPETGSLEAELTAQLKDAPGPMRLIPTHRGEGLPADEVAALLIRSRSAKNSSYAPLTPQSLTDFDWLAVVDSTTYTRGARPLPG